MSFPSPSLEPPELEPYQFEYNELVFGAGTSWGVLQCTGLDLAEIRSGDISWPRDHGQALGLDLYGGKDIIFDLWMKSDGTSLQHAQLALAAATVVRPDEELPLWFQLPNLPAALCIMCRPRKRIAKIDSDYAAGNISKPELVLHTTDPRIYSAGEETAHLKPKPPTGSTATIVNAGNTEMREIIVINGPVTRPSLQSLLISGKPTITVTNPAVERTERAARVVREAKEHTEQVEWERKYPAFITKKEHEEKLAAQKVSREAAEAAEKAAKEEREKDEAEGLEPTVAEKDQLLIDTGTPHLVQYYKGGIGVGVPEPVNDWITPSSVWWDILPGTNEIKFTSVDEAETAGFAVVQTASAYEL